MPVLVAAQAGADVTGQGPARKTATVPVSSVRRGESPRLAGEHKAHIARLAETGAPLPPILVDRRNMQVIDGMHRLLAASLRGQETVEVEFFDGSAADVFLRAIEANVAHGLPLSRADRRAAAARIVASHPQMSDRAIGEAAGLAAKTVAAIRRSSNGAAPRLNARVGKDGRVRPVSAAQGRQRAAELLARHPAASLREVARTAGISPTTVRDVRRRLQEGLPPGPGRPGAAGGDGDTAGGRPVSPPARRPKVPPAPAAVLERLLRDPSLRHHDQGRRLLRLLLQSDAAGTRELPGLAATVPSHCMAMVAQLACHYGRMWLGFAQELNDRARAIEAEVAGGPHQPMQE